MNVYPDFNWAADFEKCETESDLRAVGRAAAARIKELEAKAERLASQRDLAARNARTQLGVAEYYRDQLIAIHELVEKQRTQAAAGVSTHG